MEAEFSGYFLLKIIAKNTVLGSNCPRKVTHINVTQKNTYLISVRN